MDPIQSNLPDQSLPDGAQLTPAGGAAAVDDTLSLAELNSILGKNYKDKPTALAAVKETYNFVGKKMDAANPAPAQNDSTLVAEVSSLKEQVFFSSNPQYKGYEAIIKKMGSDPSEVVNSEEFKTIFEKAKGFDEVQQTRSVVASNPRLAQTQSAVEGAVQIANARGASATDVADHLARAINEGLAG